MTPEFDPTTLMNNPELHNDRGLLIALAGVGLVGLGYVWRWIMSDRARLVDDNAKLNDILRTQVGQLATLVTQCTAALNNNTTALTQIAALMTERDIKMARTMQEAIFKQAQGGK